MRDQARMFRWCLAVPFVLACVSTNSWHPTLVYHVPNGEQVRVRTQGSNAFVSGTAVGWQIGRPRLVTAAGDTIAIPRDARTDVLVKKSRRWGWVGLASGWAAGGIYLYSRCHGQRICGEEDPIPAFLAIAGTIVGYNIVTDRWVRVDW